MQVLLCKAHTQTNKQLGHLSCPVLHRRLTKIVSLQRESAKVNAGKSTKIMQLNLLRCRVLRLCEKLLPLRTFILANHWSPNKLRIL
ncbi:uncharacterized protein LOC108605193 isoform X2 [Drosophila busckii]|uniref:uncharacterized protein LOC108605193 isoform X2 n=1 Tax=Drosophila busckii TaxID=30019 RepID=UPI00083F501B|nr:uncharacterized protein LOC108605193 isoform X2 [Drosophila busckii]